MQSLRAVISPIQHSGEIRTMAAGEGGLNAQRMCSVRTIALSAWSAKHSDGYS